MNKTQVKIIELAKLFEWMDNYIGDVCHVIIAEYYDDNLPEAEKECYDYLKNLIFCKYGNEEGGEPYKKGFLSFTLIYKTLNENCSDAWQVILEDHEIWKKVF